MKYLAIILVSLAAACSADSASSDLPDAGTTPDAEADVAVESDMQTGEDVGSAEDAGSVDMSVEDATSIEPDMPTGPLAAEDYCELTVDMFCGYYMRCGRIVADDMDACRATFLETCNGVYEPVYLAHADAGLLSLSGEGMAACEAHLETVACEEQLFDLDGGCSEMWQGEAEAGDACAPGIGSFVCDDTSVCRIGLDLCGTCEPAAEIGGACDDTTRCPTTARCLEGVCVERGVPGASCSESAPCVIGASCVEGTCAGFSTVAVGEACDASNRCPYKSTCQGGLCVESALIGEGCTDRACASGYCDGSVCQPLRLPTQGCSENVQCASGQCNGQFCLPLVSSCITGQ